VNPIPRYTFNETRATPVHFAVSIYLDGTNKTVLTRDNLTTTGDYSAVVSSTFPGIDRGTHDLTIAVYVPGSEDAKDQLKKLVTIP
jgi:hypothetical protein